MQYGFAIDQRTCIGCHACTVACKTEHQVPVGQFRTWVKYVDSGAYPDSTRDFGVMRCNHCTDAPCVEICPTRALFKRDDGIVDFDDSQCIGCKACMQACPYDAIYIDEDTHTAAKCNFCAHRVDDGLEPACVVVCPTESIWVGDLDDPDSAISQFVAHEDTMLRAEEQGTGPNVHYVGANPDVLDPLAAPVDDTYIWAQPDSLRLAVAADFRDGTTTPASPGAPRTTLNTSHPTPWGWKVTAYTWTKGVAAGALAAAGATALAGAELGALGRIAAPLVAMAGLLVTAVLLIADLKRPERFWFLLTKPNPTSWLVKGGLALGAGAAVAFTWLVLGLLEQDEALQWLGAPAVLVGSLTAGYTAFLFHQAEGRDLWQSPTLFWHLLDQALMVGCGSLLIMAPLISAGDVPTTAAWGLVIGTAGHLALAAVELRGGHHTANAAAGIRLMTGRRHGGVLRAGLALGAATLLLGLVGALSGLGWVLALAGLLAQPALLAYEHVFVHAAQEVPLS